MPVCRRSLSSRRKELDRAGSFREGSGGWYVELTQCLSTSHHSGALYIAAAQILTVDQDPAHSGPQASTRTSPADDVSFHSTDVDVRFSGSPGPTQAHRESGRDDPRRSDLAGTAQTRGNRGCTFSIRVMSCCTCRPRVHYHLEDTKRVASTPKATRAGLELRPAEWKACTGRAVRLRQKCECKRI